MLLVIFDVKIQQCAFALQGDLVGIGLFEYALKSFWPSECCLGTVTLFGIGTPSSHVVIIGSDVASVPTSVALASGTQNATIASLNARPLMSDSHISGWNSTLARVGE